MTGVHGRTVPLGEMCHTCGQIHTQCKAHRKPKTRGGPYTPCGRPSAKSLGFDLCYLHGQNTPQVQIRAEAVMAERAMRAVLGDNTDTDPITDPIVELARLAGEVVRWKDATAEAVAALQTGDGDGLLVNTSNGQAMHPFVTMAERAQDRAAKVLVEIERLNLTERLTARHEAEARAVFDFILGGLADAGVDTPEVRAAIAARMRAVEHAGELNPGG